jgi:hypothetical protein
MAKEVSVAGHATIDQTWVMTEPITVTPSTGSSQPAIVRVGFLSDMPVGQSLVEYLDPILLAFEDAMNEGRLTQAIELVGSHVLGLPAGTAENVIAAYLDLVEQGCLLVMSVGVTNNALVLRDVINETGVPYITMAGTTRFNGSHCFSLANGGHGEEVAILAAYLAEQGLRRVVVTGEGSQETLNIAVSSPTRPRSTVWRSWPAITTTNIRVTTSSTRCWGRSVPWSPMP